MTLGTKTRGLLVAATCAAVGAGGSIVGSMAAPAKKSKTTAAKRAGTNTPGRPGFGDHGPGGRPVHEEAVVLNKAGTAYITQTEDSGKVKSVSGDEVTITEGNGTVTYKDVTVTIPSGATITRNGKTATVADLKAGDFIHVESSSDGTDVFAGDSSFRGPGDGDHHGHWGGPPPAGAPAPPAGAPAPPQGYGG